jgi:hypothetical protein
MPAKNTSPLVGRSTSGTVGGSGDSGRAVEPKNATAVASPSNDSNVPLLCPSSTSNRCV